MNLYHIISKRISSEDVYGMTLQELVKVVSERGCKILNFRIPLKDETYLSRELILGKACTNFNQEDPRLILEYIKSNSEIAYEALQMKISAEDFYTKGQIIEFLDKNPDYEIIDFREKKDNELTIACLENAWYSKARLIVARKDRNNK
jgi:hypothetical protein